MRGSRGRGSRPFPGMQLRAKVSGALGWRQAGQRGTPGQSARPGARWQIPRHSSPPPSLSLGAENGVLAACACKENQQYHVDTASEERERGLSPPTCSH